MEVERLARKYHVWNPARIAISDEMVKGIVLELTALGFKKRHVEEACEWVKDREEALGLYSLPPKFPWFRWLTSFIKSGFWSMFRKTTYPRDSCQGTMLQESLSPRQTYRKNMLLNV
jgi:hypothetical protein